MERNSAVPLSSPPPPPPLPPSHTSIPVDAQRSMMQLDLPMQFGFAGSKRPDYHPGLFQRQQYSGGRGRDRGQSPAHGRGRGRGRGRGQGRGRGRHYSPHSHPQSNRESRNRGEKRKNDHRNGFPLFKPSFLEDPWARLLSGNTHQAQTREHDDNSRGARRHRFFKPSFLEDPWKKLLVH